MPPFAFLLHSGQTVSWTQWTIHWSTVIGLAGLWAAYWWRLKSLAAPASQSPRSARPLAFAAALVSVFLSLNGPLHDLSDTFLFSAHMVQHLVLTLVFPPLLLAGLDDEILAPLVRMRVVGPLLRVLTRPAACFLVFNVVLAAWHLPPLYNTAMRLHEVHILQHLMFMGASVLMWWPIASPSRALPRLPHAGQMLYCFLMTVPMSLVSVYIVYATNVLYPAYSAAPRIAGMSPLEDQRMGGLIMWIPGGLVFVVIMTVIFFRWSATYAEDGSDHPVVAPSR